MVSERLQARLEELPTSPGVYLMKDEGGRIIYVGKAKNLRNRVRQYFQASRAHDPKTDALVRRIADFDIVVTDSDVEALVLECNLIKQHRPFYNIMLRDDKHYPYLRIDMTEDFPRLEITRKMQRDKARYFGPYLGAQSLRQVLEGLGSAFPLRRCARTIQAGRNHDRPCLYHQMGQCLAPCAGKVTPGEYRAIVKDVIRFLEGKEDDVLADLKRQMDEAANSLDFERAARLRDQLTATRRLLGQRQRVISAAREDWDIIGLCTEEGRSMVQLMIVRGGRMIGTQPFDMTGQAEGEDTPEEVVGAFLRQYYPQANVVPPTVIVPVLPEDAGVLELWLSSLRGGRVHLHAPQRGEKRSLVDLANKNARENLEREKQRQIREWQRTGGALEELAQRLSLPAPPRRIECFDISNIQGADPVASMVVFEEGKPARSQYRRFKIKTVEGPDDFASMAEVIARRFTRGLNEQQAGEEGQGDSGFSSLPDLLVVDGGRGQLNAARAVMKALGVEAIPTVGLAKREEEVYLEDRPEPLQIPRSAPASLLLQQIRDEAHRFAITYHRSLRGKRGLMSRLDSVPGVGPARRRALLKAFPSLTALKQATPEQLAAVPGIGPETARAIHDALADNPQTQPEERT